MDHRSGQITAMAKNAWRYQLNLRNRHYRYRKYLKIYTAYSQQTREKALYLIDTFARCAQSYRTSYSDVKSLAPNPDYYYYYLSEAS